MELLNFDQQQTVTTYEYSGDPAVLVETVATTSNASITMLVLFLIVLMPFIFIKIFSKKQKNG